MYKHKGTKNIAPLRPGHLVATSGRGHNPIYLKKELIEKKKNKKGKNIYNYTSNTKLNT